MYAHRWKYISFSAAVFFSGLLFAASAYAAWISVAVEWQRYASIAIALAIDVCVPLFFLLIRVADRSRNYPAATVAAVFWLSCAAISCYGAHTGLKSIFGEASAVVAETARSVEDYEKSIDEERKALTAANETALNGRTQAIRENATNQANESRKRIKQLERERPRQAALTVASSVKHPASGYEAHAVGLIFILAQGLWFFTFMQFDNEPREPVHGSVHEPMSRREPLEPMQLNTGSLAGFGEHEKPLETIDVPRLEPPREPVHEPVQIAAQSAQAGSERVTPFRRPVDTPVTNMRAKGKTWQEVAKALGVSIATAKRRGEAELAAVKQSAKIG